MSSVPRMPTLATASCCTGPTRLAGEHVQVRQHEVGLLLEVDLGVAERREPLLVRRTSSGSLPWMFGISRMNWSIEDASAAEAATRIASPTTTTGVDEHGRGGRRQRGDPFDQPVHDRADDERDQPGEEEDQDDVAEEVEG